MKVTKQIILTSIMVVVFSLGACGGGGSKSETDVTVETTTKGQRLLDLKKALDAGAISVDEYEKERKRILGE